MSTAGGNTQQAYNQGMIIPPPKNKEDIERTKTLYLAVDSRDRNHRDYPNSSSYTIPLESNILDVESIQLISYKIPAPQFPVRLTNNALYLATAPPTVNPSTLDVDYHSNCVQEIRIQPGYYSETTPLVARVATGTNADALGTAIQAEQGGAPLLQDALATQVEYALNSDSIGGNSTYVVHVVSSSKYVFQTDFSNQCNVPTPGCPNICAQPTFFHMFFQGPDEYYGATTYERVNVSSDPCNPIYEEKTIGKTQPMYMKDSLGPVIGVPRTGMSTKLTGQVYVDAGDPTVLHGIGTTFENELILGDWLYVTQLADNIPFRIKVTEITTNTLCCISTGVPGGGDPPVISPAVAWRGRYEATWVRNVMPDAYIVMKVRECDTLQSYNDTLNKSFFLVPTTSTTFTEIREYLPLKKFKPIRGRLDKLTMRFCNVDGTEYDFMGRDHVLLFRIVCYRQNISHGDFSNY
jgi:hypothetical protein